MTDAALLFASGLLLFAYFLGVAGRRYRLPAVVLLIASGMALRQILDPVGVELKWITPVVPMLGTIGLILIVLEGALDLAVTRKRIQLIAVSATSALLGFVVTLAAIATLLVAAFDITTADAILASIPFSVISSAVAIPSAAGLASEPREFVVYESSLSDIIGVLVFYAWLNADGSARDFAIDLFGGGAISLAVALLVAPAIFFFLNRIDGHVRFLPLIAGIVFLYTAGKVVHLSPLVLVLGCGLLLNNPHLANWSRRLSAWRGDNYDQRLKEFKGLVAELTFAAKSFFFLLLGYWTNLEKMASWSAWGVATTVFVVVFASRALILRLLRQPDAAALTWIAPRGLITVLLFIAAADAGKLHEFSGGAVMLVVLATSAATALSRLSTKTAALPVAAAALSKPPD
jgi:cell volume regulation protein A